MRWKHLYLVFLLSWSFSACGSGSSTTQDFSEAEKIFLHDLFLDEYLWYDEVAREVDYTLYDTPQSMINALRIMPPDSWSFHMTTDEYEDFANQQTSGFGFGYTAAFDIYLVRIGAPAYGKLFRGDKLLMINHQPIDTELLKLASENLGVETTFTLLREGNEIEVNVTPQTYTFSVSSGSIIDYEDKKVGYLNYDSFTESSVAEFESIFTTFKQNDIDELVIDLRYNGGGSLDTTSALLDNITNAYPSRRQFYLDWNDQNKAYNENYHFESELLQDGNELTMPRVFFLVTQNSASASEALINALIPYLGENNIITVGNYTHGKPVGMRGRTYGTSYYFLINFFVRNEDMQTTSFDGIAPTCSAVDDLTYQRGDPNEPMFATALHYIKTNSCP